MTTARTLSVVRGIVTNLSSASVLGSGKVGVDYSHLERTLDVAAVIGWKNVRSVPEFGMGGMVRYKARLATYVAQVYVKDTGSASAVMDMTITAMDKIVTSIEGDDTLQDNVESVVEIRAIKNPGEAFVVNTVAFIPFDVEIDVLEWPN